MHAQSAETHALAGGLPTFVDVGDSFGAPALLEDNLVASLRRCGRRVALLGDDTWLQLFPASVFAVAHPFPSFNVADLHTVDDGVAAHLAPLLADPGGWDVLVAHFLGVDHAGHTHGVDSAETAAKLAQMDAQAASVVEALASDAAHDGTLLLLLGDHGMTWAGDHGGASDEETRSALFAMRPRGGGERKRNGALGAEMPQLDFAATLALLLGVPVPFGSVGRVSAPLWAAAGGDAAGFAAARRANAWQVARAMDAYSAAGAFAPADVAALRRLYADAAETDDAAAADAFLAAAAALARAQWTTFGAAPMGAGLAVLAAALAAHAYALRAAMPSSVGDADTHAPLAVAAAVIAAASMAGPFSVGFMQVEQAASHAPMLAYAAASALLAAWRLLRGRAGAAQLGAACALLAATAGIALAAMPGEDKPGGADAAALPPLRLAAAAARALLPLAALPLVLLPRAKARSAWIAAAAWACHAAVALHWAAHDAAAAGWRVPLDAARAARLLLPRTVFAVSAGMALAAATGVARGGVSSPGSASRHALAALAAPLLLLSGRSAPLLALLAAAQAAALLRCHAACAPPDAAHAPAGANTATRPAAPLTRCGVLSLAIASHFAALQLFGATGHRSSFDALHFKAAFTVRHAYFSRLALLLSSLSAFRCIRGSMSSTSRVRARCLRPTRGPPSWLLTLRCPRWRIPPRVAISPATLSGARLRCCWRPAGCSTPLARRPPPRLPRRCGDTCTFGRCLLRSLFLRRRGCCSRTRWRWPRWPPQPWRSGARSRMRHDEAYTRAQLRGSGGAPAGCQRRTTLQSLRPPGFLG